MFVILLAVVALAGSVFKQTGDTEMQSLNLMDEMMPAAITVGDRSRQLVNRAAELKRRAESMQVSESTHLQSLASEDELQSLNLMDDMMPGAITEGDRARELQRKAKELKRRAHEMKLAEGGEH